MKNIYNGFNVYSEYIYINVIVVSINNLLTLVKPSRKVCEYVYWWCNMKVYSVILIQLMIWSGYTLIEWLSKHDQLIYNIIMFFVFFYLAIIIGNYIMKSTKKTIVLTIISLGIYTSFHFGMSFLYS